MSIFKKKYRVNTVPKYNEIDNSIEVEYMPQVRAWYSFKWLNILSITLPSENLAWDFIEQAKAFPKPIYKK